VAYSARADRRGGRSIRRDRARAHRLGGRSARLQRLSPGGGAAHARQPAPHRRPRHGRLLICRSHSATSRAAPVLASGGQFGRLT